MIILDYLNKEGSNRIMGLNSLLINRLYYIELALQVNY